MLRYDYINKEWIVSATAYRVYRVSAYLSIMLFLAWCYALTEGIPRAYAPVARPLVFVGVFGVGTVFVGMEYFLFRFDESHPLKQMAWFCVMLFPMLGPALYCLLVYSRSSVVKNALSSQATTSSIDRGPH
jgi:hypothetical protein